MGAKYKFVFLVLLSVIWSRFVTFSRLIAIFYVWDAFYPLKKYFKGYEIFFNVGKPHLDYPVVVFP